EEAAGDLTGRKGLFLVIDGEREEIDTRLRLLVADGGAEHHGVAIGRQHGAIGLTGDAAGFEGELAAAPDQFFAENLEHINKVLSLLRIIVPENKAATGWFAGPAKTMPRCG